MHDKNGTELRVGDRVSIEYVITHVYGGEDFCNLSAESVAPRKPDGFKETFVGNTAVCVLVERAAPAVTDTPDMIQTNAAPVYGGTINRDAQPENVVRTNAVLADGGTVTVLPTEAAPLDEVPF